MMSGPFRIAVLLTSVVATATGAGVAAHSWNRTSRTREANVVHSPVASSPAPQLTVTKTPLRAPAGPATIVTITGQGFEPSLTMTLTSPSHVFTFGSASLEDVGAESFRFDAAAIPDGTYDLTVSNGAGRSGAVKFVMQRKQGVE